jgi:hypothetical protein
MSAGGFFGALLVIAGVLLALLCGLCTLAVIGATVSAQALGGPHGGGAAIPLALLIGGVPTVFGCLMVWAGIVLIRSSLKSAQPPVKPEDVQLTEPDERR